MDSSCSRSTTPHHHHCHHRPPAPALPVPPRFAPQVARAQPKQRMVRWRRARLTLFDTHEWWDVLWSATDQRALPGARLCPPLPASARLCPAWHAAPGRQRRSAGAPRLRSSKGHCCSACPSVRPPATLRHAGPSEPWLLASLLILLHGRTGGLSRRCAVPYPAPARTGASRVLPRSCRPALSETVSTLLCCRDGLGNVRLGWNLMEFV